VSSSGEEGDEGSEAPAVSADGRFIAFQSIASNLVPGGGPERSGHIFVRDRQTGQTERLTSYSGDEFFNGSGAPSISADGRYVAFHSRAVSLAPGDTKTFNDVFVVDRQKHTTQKISVSAQGTLAKGDSSFPMLSADGRYVAFISNAPDLVPGDTNRLGDVFVYDRQTGVTERANVSSSGAQTKNFTRSFALSANGRFVAFQSLSNNMVAGDSNRLFDIFVRDRQTHLTRRVSIDSAGQQANGESSFPTISADGRFVAFESYATNLVPGDKNFALDIFEHDAVTGRTKRVNFLPSGFETHADSDRAKLSADGHFVVFRSAAPLATTDLHTGIDLYIRELAVPQ
jgi:Tol biopolymer transport system component